MDEPSRPLLASVPNLKEAVRRARLADADRSAAVADLHAAEIARLEILAEALGPVLAQLPDDAALFDHGLVPGEQPRLHIDILAFVEMARDRRQYRFVQDTRWGRRLILEHENLQEIVRAVTDYIALRLVERAKALESDGVQGVIAAPEPSLVSTGSVPASDPAGDTGRAARVAACLWFLTGLILGGAVLYGAQISHYLTIS